SEYASHESSLRTCNRIRHLCNRIRQTPTKNSNRIPSSSNRIPSHEHHFFNPFSFHVWSSSYPYRAYESVY
ncbi:hypothetical protein VIGAN_01188600, partial [Vigna angularis var. angularis]